MMISIGADHRGYELKQHIIDVMKDHQWLDVGTNEISRTDYPVFAKKVCQDILAARADCGVLICGTGVGMAIAANRYRGIYAALCWNVEVARQSREDDCANVLVLPSDYVSFGEARSIVISWLLAIFKGGRYQERIDMIDAC